MSIVKGLAVFVAVLALVSGQTIVTPPMNTVVQSGADARINCTVDGDVSNNMLAWKELITDPTGVPIYKSDMDATNDPANFAILGHYDLLVREADVIDAGWYTCQLAEETVLKAYLIVTEVPSIMQNSIEYTEGHEYNIGCSVRYGAPTFNVDPKNMPILRANVGQRVVAEHKLSAAEGTIGKTASDMMISFNYTALPEDHGETVDCTVMTLEPEFQLTSSFELDIKYAVSSVNIVSMQLKYRVGEKIMCKANGNPEPSYRWTNLNSPSNMDEITGATLTITSMMANEANNKWQCTAMNRVDEEVQVDAIIEFYAEDRPDYSGSSSVWSSSVIVSILLAAVYRLL